MNCVLYIIEPRVDVSIFHNFLFIRSIALGLDPLIVRLLLKFLGVKEILLVHGHYFLKLKR